MRFRWRLVMLALASAAALSTFHVLHRQLAALGGAGYLSEVVASLERSQADLKRLAQADPEHRDDYHRRFLELQALANRLRILDHNRAELAGRQQALVLVAVVIAFAALGAVLALGARRDARRLARVGDALERLAAGAPDVRLRDRGRDHIGVVARMIERTSEVVARDRQRLASLRHLAAWQEAARRQAHELRTPLTVARLAVDRMQERLQDGSAEARLAEAAASLAELRVEIQRLDQLVQQFAAFARLPQPVRRRDDASELLRDFAATFAGAWPGLGLVACAPLACIGCFDRAMIRQVLVNLCENSARALRGRPGTVRLAVRSTAAGRLAIEVEDDGPGVAPEVRSRIFEPYVTTATAGEGMGLGLAICRKILLDHGGELELVEDGRARGATFRLTLPGDGPCPA